LAASVRTDKDSAYSDRASRSMWSLRQKVAIPATLAETCAIPYAPTRTDSYPTITRVRAIVKPGCRSLLGCPTGCPGAQADLGTGKQPGPAFFWVERDHEKVWRNSVDVYLTPKTTFSQGPRPGHVLVTFSPLMYARLAVESTRRSTLDSFKEVMLINHKSVGGQESGVSESIYEGGA
jgi:hypothetical protein